MEGSLLKSDNWQYISTFLTIQELCRLTRVSRACFFFWMDDRYWSYQKQRVCFHFPELSPLFEENSYTKKKRKKSEWSMPRKGTWWVFKKYLSLGFNMKGLIKSCEREVTHALVLAVISFSVPTRELITERKVLSNPKKEGLNYSAYRISFWTPSVRYTFLIRSGSNCLDLEIYYIPKNAYKTVYETNKTQGIFKAWKDFLFQNKKIIKNGE